MPLLVQIDLQPETTSKNSFHNSEDAPFCAVREFGECDLHGRYRLALSITNIPPGRSLGSTRRTQALRQIPSTSAKSRLPFSKSSVTLTYALVRPSWPSSGWRGLR